MMILSPTRNQSSAAGADHTGRMILELTRAMVASGFWRRIHQGDGLSAYSSGTSDIFTHNTNGYLTSGIWDGGNANSISNARAYVCVEELDGVGAATGRQLLLARGTGTAGGNDRLIVQAFAWEPFTGSPSATVSPTAPTLSKVVGTINGAGANIWGHLATSPQMGGAGGAIVFNYWVCDSPSGTTEDVCPFAVEAYDSTADELAFVIAYDALVDADDADPHPCAVSLVTLTTGAPEWGEVVEATPPAAFGTTTAAQCWFSVGASSVDSWGAVRGSAVAAISATGSTFPSATSTDVINPSALRPIFPAPLWSDGDGVDLAAYKGTLESVEVIIQDSQGWPNTYFASVAHASEPARVAMGPLTLPWEVGVSRSGVSATNYTNLRRVMSLELLNPPDSTAPVVTFNQAAGAIAYNATLTVDITDNADDLAQARASVVYSGGEHVVYDGSSFTSEFNAAGAVTPITDGVRLTIKADDGFTGAFTLKVYGRDGDGNETTSTRAYTISTSPNPAAPDSTAPVVTLVSPTNGRLSKFSQIVVDVTDDRALRYYELWAFWDNDLIPAELVYSAVRPTVATLYTTSASNISGGVRITLQRKSGWAYAPRIVPVAVDTSGNMNA